MAQQDRLLFATTIIACILTTATWLAVQTEIAKPFIAGVSAVIVAFVIMFLGIIMSMLIEIRSKIGK